MLADPQANRFTFEDRYCDICAGSAIHHRVRRHEHSETDKRLGKQPPPGQRRAGDGHHVKMRRLTPDELAAALRRTPPTP